MSKNPKSIVISFRLPPLVIAKAIDGLKNYDKAADITKLSNIIKQTTLHGINYLTNALPWEPTTESQVIVHNLTTQGKKAISIEQSILSQPLKIPINSTTEETSYLERKNKEPSISVKSAVTDFSMTRELMQELRGEDKEEDICTCGELPGSNWCEKCQGFFGGFKK